MPRFRKTILWHAWFELQKQIVQEYLVDPNDLEVEAALIYQKYGEDEE